MLNFEIELINFQMLNNLVELSKHLEKDDKWYYNNLFQIKKKNIKLELIEVDKTAWEDEYQRRSAYNDAINERSAKFWNLLDLQDTETGENKLIEFLESIDNVHEFDCKCNNAKRHAHSTNLKNRIAAIVDKRWHETPWAWLESRQSEKIVNLDYDHVLYGIKYRFNISLSRFCVSPVKDPKYEYYPLIRGRDIYKAILEVVDELKTQLAEFERNKAVTERNRHRLVSDIKNYFKNNKLRSVSSYPFDKSCSIKLIDIDIRGCARLTVDDIEIYLSANRIKERFIPISE